MRLLLLSLLFLLKRLRNRNWNIVHMVCCTVYGMARILECDSFQWVCNVTQTSQFFRSCKLFSHKKNYCSLLFIKLVSEWTILFSLKKWQRVGSLLESSVCINDKIFQNYYIFKSDRSFIKRSSYFFKEHVHCLDWVTCKHWNKFSFSEVL